MTHESLDLHHLRVTHAGVPLVDVADVGVVAGRPVTIVGESGSGKSLLAHAVMGTLAPELGAVGSLSLGGRDFDLADRDSRRGLWGRELALLPQEPALALDPTMRVLAQVSEGAPGLRGRPAQHRAAAVLDRLGLAHTARFYPYTLSGGMAQRVAYAAATVGEAHALIVDEPSKGLDRAALDRLAELLAAHAASGGLLLTITHDLDLARRLGGEVLVMRDAAVVERGPAERVLSAPAHAYTRRLLAAEPSHWDHDWMSAGPALASRRDEAAPPLVTAELVTKAYGDVRLFQDLTLEIRAGERWAITGPSGVGKTTLGNVLLGLARADAGTVRHDPALAGGRLQKLYQDPALSFPPRVRLGLALRDVARRHGVDRGRVMALLDAVGLPEALLERRPGQVSGGELQRLAIVRAMLLRPALMFADEATSRLDLVTRESTMRCLMTEVVDSDAALLLVSHDRELARTVADRHLVLGEGGRASRERMPQPAS